MTTEVLVVVPLRTNSMFLEVPMSSTKIVTVALPPQTMYDVSTNSCGPVFTVYLTLIVYADYFLCPTIQNSMMVPDQF